LFKRVTTSPMAGAIGAELSGADLSQPLDAQCVAEIRHALHHYLVIVFRDQNLTLQQFLDFARNFADILPYPMVQGLADFPDIVPVLKRANENLNFGGLWHTDTAYLAKPPMGSMLLARTLPPHGGDTIWANMNMAYETLSDGMKAMLQGLVGVNSAAKPGAAASREDRRADAAKDDSGLATQAEHPVVRTHPVTGNKSLYVNFAHTVRFKNMTEAESQPILQYLFHHQTRPEFTCQLRWQVGTIAFWDNRAAQHNPINDYGGYERLLHRITLAGEKPY
jgi:taurine dioxygenase